MNQLTKDISTLYSSLPFNIQSKDQEAINRIIALANKNNTEYNDIINILKRVKTTMQMASLDENTNFTMKMILNRESRDLNLLISKIERKNNEE